LHQESLPIHPHIRTPELTELLARLGAEGLGKVLQDLETFLVKALPQNENDSTLAPKISPEMSHVQWESQSGVAIYNLYRGLSGLFKLKTTYLGRPIDLDDIAIFSPEEPTPVSKMKFETQPIDINSTADFSNNYYNSPVTVHIKSLPASSAQLRPGYIHYTEDTLCVKCFSSSQDSGDIRQNWIFIRKVKMGTKWMSAKDFRNGFLTKKGAADCFESILNHNLSDRAVA
jgi:methionyl-tRNA formyltransferase